MTTPANTSKKPFVYARGHNHADVHKQLRETLTSLTGTTPTEQTINNTIAHEGARTYDVNGATRAIVAAETTPDSSHWRMTASEWHAHDEISKLVICDVTRLPIDQDTFRDTVRDITNAGTPVESHRGGWRATNEDGDGALRIMTDIINLADARDCGRVDGDSAVELTPGNVHAIKWEGGRPPTGYESGPHGYAVASDNLDDVCRTLQAVLDGEISQREAADRIDVTPKTIRNLLQHPARYNLTVPEKFIVRGEDGDDGGNGGTATKHTTQPDPVPPSEIENNLPDEIDVDLGVNKTTSTDDVAEPDETGQYRFDVGDETEGSA